MFRINKFNTNLVQLHKEYWNIKMKNMYIIIFWQQK